MRTYKRRSDITSLPQDLLVEIATRLASASPTPLLDVKNLRTSCKMFRAASTARKVGKSMAVCKEQNKRWWDKDGYLELLHHCARSGNLHASYILGLEHIYNLRRTVTGLRYLQRARAGGHRAAAYTLGVLKFCVPDTRSRGMELLNGVADGDASSTDAAVGHRISGHSNIEICRREAVAVLRSLTMRKMILEPKLECRNPRCGEILEGSNMWLRDEELRRRFCSEECRWRDEVYLFKRLM